jgi:hypothetical protein
MQIDTFIKQGNSHKFCEDYVLKTDTYAMVLDGCSSSENVEFGNRLIAHTIVEREKLLHNQKFIENINLVDIMRWMQEYGLNKEAFNTTFLFLKEVSENYFIIKIYGDGLYINIYENVIDLRCEVINYIDNAPFYYVYSLCENDENSYYNQYKGIVSYKLYGNYNNNFILKKEFEYNEKYFQRIFEKGIYSIIATDGLLSFINDKQELYPIEKLIPRIIDFKNDNGVFLQRRMNKLIKELGREGYYNFDDIGMAVIKW